MVGKKILVLGSEGQIGQYLVAAAPDRVIRSDVTLSADHDLRKPINQIVRAQMREADIVLFLSFDVGGSAYLAQQQFSADYLDNNFRLMINTFELLRQTGKPFLFASSQMSNMLDSPYGVLKRVGEFFTTALGGINLRFWNVYGLEHDPDKFHVITDLIKGARKGAIHLRTDGHESRQFLFAADCAEALITLVDHYDELESATDVYYDITSFEWTTILDLAHLVAQLHGNVPVYTTAKEDKTQTIRNEPSDTILHFWQPTTSLEDGIREIMEAM